MVSDSSWARAPARWRVNFPIGVVVSTDSDRLANLTPQAVRSRASVTECLETWVLSLHRTTRQRQRRRT